jgi:hypothetical protein
MRPPAMTFLKSKAWTDLGSDRDKALKTTRRYAVETLNQVVPAFSRVI